MQRTRALVLKKLHDTFPDALTADAALKILDAYGSEPWHRERERIQLAALMLCERNLSRLQQMVDLASRDFRDLLVAAEYPESAQAFPKTPDAEVAARKQRERERYEAWLNSD